jgi:hypothetical protein
MPQVEAVAQVACSGLDPGGNPARSGLYGQYYRGYYKDDQTYFTRTTPVLTRVDANVNFATEDSFGEIGLAAIGGSPANPDEFSMRERGSLYIGTAHTYTFYLSADDAAYLWFDNAALKPVPVLSEAAIANGGVHFEVMMQASVYLTKGWHNILLHYGEQHRHNVVVLEYESLAAGVSRQVIPSKDFCTGVQPALPTKNELLLSAFPNPNVGKFTVRVAQNEPEAGRLQLLDIHGRACYSQLLPSFIQEEVAIKTTGMPTGVYLLYLTTASGKVARQKIIITGGK